MVLIAQSQGRRDRRPLGADPAPAVVGPPHRQQRLRTLHACLVVEAEQTVFGVDAVVWGDLLRTVPVRVLDQVLDTWQPDIVSWAESSAEEQRDVPPAGARLGHEPASVFEDAAALRAELEDEMDALCEAPGLISADESKPATGDLAGLLRDRLDLAQLTAALDRPQSQVMAILRGKMPLGAEDIARIAEATGLPQEQVAASVRTLPHSLVEKVEHPRWRPAVRLLAQQEAVDEVQARLRLGYGAFALAARETGGASQNWDARLQQFMASRGEGGIR